MRIHDVLLVLSAFISEALGTVTGFGSSTLFVPLGSLFESLYFILALTSILHCFGNISRFFLFKKSFNSAVFFRLFLPSVLMTGIGALLVPFFPVDFLKKILGFVLVITSLLLFLFQNRKWVIGQRAVYPIMGLSGLFTGLVGTGGAIRGIALSALNLDKYTFVVISASVDFFGDFVRMLVYLSHGYMDWHQWFYLPLLGAAAYAGVQVGRIILRRLSQSVFNKIIFIYIFISGILLIAGV